MHGRAINEQELSYINAAATYGPAIARLARGYEADVDLSHDLIQEIHVALWRSFGYFEKQCSERTWVFRIAHNVAVTHVISRQRLRNEVLVALEDLEAVHTFDDLESHAGESQLIKSLMAAIHRLKPADRQVVLLYLEELTASEIGEVTGLSANAVAVRIHRVKALLAAHFKGDH